ncbi:DUF4238 domain-containing protein [Microbacterium sp. 179-B 1A2 NHS]|uniref:DUF4238 domain-containing protein n=1 Tax=Microbacterium sp. 179-B 1A2 NHS TaxID=3142383 RepID=UPI0039A34957
MAIPHDHYISRVHMRQWAIDNRVTVLRRGGSKPKVLDVGKAIAAEQGLNNPLLEAAYGKVENSFARALPQLIGAAGPPTDDDWRAVREYAVLMHDRYPALRGSAMAKNGLPGGNAMMVPNPAHWGDSDGALDALSNLATVMDREQLKEARLQFLPISARLLPPQMQVLHVGPLLLGDAGVHAISLHPDAETLRSYVAMPVSCDALIVFGRQLPDDEEAIQIGQILRMKVAMESTVVVDTPEAPIIEGFVAEMWSGQPAPSGTGLPSSIDVWTRFEHIPDSRARQD